MTATVMNHTVRRLLTLGTATACAAVGVVAASVASAGSASAETPAGWPATEPVDTGFVLGVLVGIPLLLFVLIALATYLPAMVRGERLAPGATGAEDLWLGGRRDAGQLSAATPPGPATAEAEAGGASARW